MNVLNFLIISFFISSIALAHEKKKPIVEEIRSSIERTFQEKRAFCKRVASKKSMSYEKCREIQFTAESENRG